MKAAVIVFPGSNCDRDIATAIEKRCGCAAQMIWHKETELPPLDLIVLPGGFSYGDYLRAGSMAANSPIMSEVIACAHRGVAVLGICNGFQVLTETGLLPGALMRNAGLQFICREVFVKIEARRPPFTSCYAADRVEAIYIAHHDGNYYADETTIAQLEDDDRVALRYCDKDGNINQQSNPNGSMHNIAGIFNEAGNVLGLMPHPERSADEALSRSMGGAALFDSLAANL